MTAAVAARRASADRLLFAVVAATACAVWCYVGWSVAQLVEGR